MTETALHPTRPGRLAGAHTETRPARRRTFHTLDALRGIAALIVLLFHAAFFYGIAKPAEGQLAVDLFFVMSGFIVAHRYEPDLRRGMDFRRFVRIRLIRLYPLFLLGMVLGIVPAAAVLITGGHGDALHKGLVESFPLAVFMLPSPFALPKLTELYPLNYVAWSLALELLINVVYAATFRAWTNRNLLLWLGTAFAGLVACAVSNGGLDAGFAWSQAYIGIARVLYGFPAGVLLYRIYECRGSTLRFPWWVPLLLTLAMFVVDVQHGRAAWELFAITTAIPLTVAIAIVSEPPKILHKACAVAGLLSYPLYSLHAPFIGLFMRGESLAHLSTGTQTHLESISFTVLLAGLCVIAQFLYDSPIRRFLTERRSAILPAPEPLLTPAAHGPC